MRKCDFFKIKYKITCAAAIISIRMGFDYDQNWKISTVYTQAILITQL